MSFPFIRPRYGVALLFLLVGSQLADFAIKLHKRGTGPWWTLPVSAVMVVLIYREEEVSRTLKARLGLVALSAGVFAELVRTLVCERASSPVGNLAAGTFAVFAWFLVSLVPDDAQSGRRA